MPPRPTVESVWPTGPASTLGGRNYWVRLGNRIRRCRRCPLGFERTHVVIHRGSLHPKVLFVGEAPGRAEDRIGVPFVGAAGVRLDRAIATLGLAPEEVAVVNVIKCRPPRNRFRQDAAAACRPFLARQVAWLKPSIVVPMGVHALAAFRPDLLPISSAAGRAYRWRAISLFPLLHPAATLHSAAFGRRWEHDLTRLDRFLKRTGVVKARPSLLQSTPPRPSGSRTMPTARPA